MKKYFLKICSLLLIMLLISNQVLLAQQWIDLSSVTSAKTKIKLVSSDIENSLLSFAVAGFYKNEVTTSQGKAFKISIPNATQMLEAGAPDLPKLTASLIIPDQSTMKLEVTASSFTDFFNIDLAPSKGNLLRTINPDEVPYKYGEVYSKNEFYPSQIASLRAPYILRDYRGQTVIVSPFQYNPVTKVLRVYTLVMVRVFNEKAGGENLLNRIIHSNKVDHEFASVYQQHFKNYMSAQYIPADENGNLLVICPSQWMSIVQPLVDWKIQKGIPTEIVDVITAGGSASNIKNFITDYYNTHNLTHVLLVGDDAQMPTLTASGGASDPSYGYILGYDSYAEVFVGRFSAQTAAEVQTQVERTLNYEKYPDSTGSWYDKGVVVASNQGPGDDGEMDWEHEVNIRTDLLGFTYVGVTELYDGTHPGTTDATGDPSNADLLNSLQNGVSIMSYTGHGSTTSFGTTGFSNSDIPALTNVNKLPFIWSVGCVNGDFLQTTGPCIGEEFLTAQSNNQPTGAIATLMSSINQSWDPPMDAQDEMIDLLVESYSNNIKRTFGGISVNACMHMNDQYGLAGSQMTDTWICFGDPTLNVRTANPQQITVTHPDTITVGTSSFAVNCSHNSALVAITMNGTIISTGIINGGSVQLNFPAINVIDTLYLTVTGFNLMPYFAQVLMVPANGPYVIYQSNISHDVIGNSNGMIDYDESVNVDLTLTNLGLANANNLIITLSTADQYVNIFNANATLNNIVAGANNSILNAFSYTVGANIPDQHVIQFLLTVTDGSGNTWNSSFTQIVNAPALVIGNLIINDSVGGNGNGILEPGETGDAIVECLNNGHSDALAGFVSLSTSNPFVTLNNAAANLNVLVAQAQSTVTFNLSLVGNLMFATPYDISCQLSTGLYFVNKLFYRTAGENLEDFETNNFNKYGWTTLGNQPWFTTNYLPFQGLYCAQSGNINDNETSGLRLSINVLMDDSVSFWYKVSSEQDWDFLNFKIDMVKINQWSGIVPWTYAAYPITGGPHFIMFSYEKDVAVSTGMDCAWLDNIKLPPGAMVTSINNELADENGLICYPNPANSFINLTFNAVQNCVAKFELLDINGRVVNTKVLSGHSGLNFVQLATGELNAGVYILKIENDNHVFYKKIVIE